MRTILAILYFGLILLLGIVGTIDSVVYSNEGFSRWIPYILIFGVQPVVLYFLLRDMPMGNFKIKQYLIVRGIIATSVLIIVLSYLYFSQIRGDNDLASNGQRTYGIVKKKWLDTYKQKSNWLLICKFNVDGKTYSTFSESDKENKYSIGDTLTIIYSTRFPGNCKIEELQDN